MKDGVKTWMVKVLTDLGTRLLIVIKPHLLVKDLQGDTPMPGPAGVADTSRSASI